MARPAAVSANQIRATVLAMLAEAGDATPNTSADATGPVAPVTRERFRRAISVRRLRARLGAGDPAVLSRALNAIEAELVQAGMTQIALPGLPDAIAEQMRALWAAAVGVQLDDVVRLKAEARAETEAAKINGQEVALRVELLRVELADLRTQLLAREAELATARAECRSAATMLAAREQSEAELKRSAHAATQTLEEARSTHAAALEALHTRYEGLSKRLLQETEHQRHALATERERLSTQLADAQTRIAALEGLREHLLDDLAAERDTREHAEAEASALATVVSEQRHALQALRLSQTDSSDASVRHRAARTGMPRHAGAAAVSPRARPRSSRPSRSGGNRQP